MKRIALILCPLVSLIALLKWREMRSFVESKRRKLDALLAQQGSGRHIWADEHADEYINRLREGWD